MARTDDAVDVPETSLDAPLERDREYVDVADLPPPEPMRVTLETLAVLPPDGVLIQANDREPQFLYPKLEDRGFEWATATRDDGRVVTAIWQPG
jgi:hypothetical protein